jgi:hypothetical protein
MFIPSVQFLVKMKLRGSLHPKNDATVSLDESTLIDTFVAIECTLLPPHDGISV